MTSQSVEQSFLDRYGSDARVVAPNKKVMDLSGFIARRAICPVNLSEVPDETIASTIAQSLHEAGTPLHPADVHHIESQS